jgi:signal transduction histidine kinase
MPRYAAHERSRQEGSTRVEQLRAALQASRAKMAAARIRVERALEIAHRQTASFPIRAEIEKLKEAVDERERAQASMQTTIAAKDRYLAQFAHEVRQALQGCVGACSVLRVRTADASTRRAVDVLDRQLKRMTQLVEDVIVVIRGERGRIALHKAPIPVARVIDAALETVGGELEERRHAVHVAIDRTLTIEADETRLEQVFANLLVNAAKYTEPGGNITITGKADGDYAIVVVRDSGRGLTESELGSIFDPFTSSEMSTGLGVGLAIAADLVKLHGGAITARSDGRGQGSEFTVRLPLVQRDVLDQR